MRRTILLVLFLFSFSLSAQKLKKFSSEPDAYITELEGFLRDLDKDRGDALFLKVSPLFQTELEPSEQQMLVDISNNLLKKRCLPSKVGTAFFLLFYSLVSKKKRRIGEPG